MLLKEIKPNKKFKITENSDIFIKIIPITCRVKSDIEYNGIPVVNLTKGTLILMKGNTEIIPVNL